MVGGKIHLDRSAFLRHYKIGRRTFEGYFFKEGRMKRILLLFIILALLSMNVYIFWENQKLKKEVENRIRENGEKENVAEKSLQNSRLLGLFFDGILSQDEKMAGEFTAAVQNSSDEEILARYQEVVKSSSPESLLNFGEYLNQNNIELLSE